MSFVLGGSFGKKPCVIPRKVAAAGDERYLECAAVAAAVVFTLFFCSGTVASSCFRCVSVCAVIGYLGLQIAVEWLHECCHVVLPCESRDAGWQRDVAKRIVVAASRCRSGAAACMILVSFAAEHRKSYWSGCMKVAMVIFQ